MEANKKSVPRKKDAADYTIGEGSLLSIAYCANDLRTQPANARKILRRLKCPMIRIGNRWFVHRERYHAALLACEIDPNVTRDKKRA